MGRRRFWSEARLEARSRLVLFRGGGPAAQLLAGGFQLFAGDAGGGEGLVFFTHGAAGFDDLAGSILDFPVPVGVGANAALAAQFDLIGRLFAHEGAYGPDCRWGEEGMLGCRPA